MHELLQGKCASCGYPSVDMVAARGALPCQTVLINRLELGNPLGSSYQSIAYIAYDRQENTPVIVLEFFPRQIVSRKGEEVVVRNNRDLFMNATRIFLTSPQPHPLQLMMAFAANNTAYRVYRLNSHSALAAKDAEQLLDLPILFRNEQNKPTMSVNALVIPPMPKQREWKLAAKLAKEQKRRKSNRIISAVAAVVVLALGGIFAYDAIREHDVTVQVKTSSPVSEALLGNVALPNATPDADGMVTYQTKARKGSYLFYTANEQGMMQTTLLTVPAKEPHQVSIPTPSPTPIPAIELQAEEWILHKDGQYYVAPDLVNPSISRPAENTLMAKIHLTGTARFANADTCAIQLRRGADTVELAWNNNTIDFAVSEGEYELLLRCDENVRLLERFTADSDKTIQLDMDAIVFYHDYLCQLPAEQKLYYVGDHASITLDGTDAAGINAWADKYPDLFGAYRQYPVTFQLDSRLASNAQVTIDGLSWKRGDTVTLCEGQNTVTAVITTGSISNTEVVHVDFTSAEPVILGKEGADESATRWQDATGLMTISGQTYLVCGEEARLLDEVELAELKEDMQVSKLAFASSLNDLTHVIINLDSSVSASQVGSVVLNGHALPSGVNPLQYAFSATPGSYNLQVNFANGADSLAETITVPASAQTTIHLMKDEVMQMMKLRNSLTGSGIDSAVRLSGHYAFVPTPAEGTVDVTAQQAVQYAQIYDVFEDAFVMHPVMVTVDKRIDTAAIQNMQLEDQPLQELAHIVNVDQATQGSYPVSVTLQDGQVYRYTLDVAPQQDNKLVLLTDAADAAIAQLSFWGPAADKLALQKSAPSLTAEAVDAVLAQADAHQVRVTGPAELMALPFTMKYAADQEGLQLVKVEQPAPVLLTVATDTDAQAMETTTPEPTPAVVPQPPMVEGYMTTGSYDLYVTYEGQSYYLLTREIAQDELIPLFWGDFAGVPVPTPTPEPTPEPTPTPKRHWTPKATPKPTPTKKPADAPTKKPADAPTNIPAVATSAPNTKPTDAVIVPPTETNSGNTNTPTTAPTNPPAETSAPATQAPATQAPATQAPATQAPATQAPTATPKPTDAPTKAPTAAPTATPKPEENRGHGHGKKETTTGSVIGDMILDFITGGH